MLSKIVPLGLIWNPLHRTLHTILLTRVYLDSDSTVQMKDTPDKCMKNYTMYPSVKLNTSKTVVMEENKIIEIILIKGKTDVTFRESGENYSDKSVLKSSERGWLNG